MSLSKDEIGVKFPFKINLWFFVKHAAIISYYVAESQLCNTFYEGLFDKIEHFMRDFSTWQQPFMRELCQKSYSMMGFSLLLSTPVLCGQTKI